MLPTGKINLTLKRAKQSGFTLVEVMVVLLIVGLMAGTVVMNLPPKQDPLYAQGRLLATRLEQASQTSLIEQSSIGVRFVEGGYEVLKYTGENWDDAGKYFYDLSNNPNISLSVNGGEIDLKAARKSEFPVVRFDATGLATPFELSLQTSVSSVRLKGGVDGSITLVLGEDFK